MLFKRLRCKHENQVCITNIHGDLRHIYNCMSVWKCKDCGKVFYKDVLDPNCKLINFWIEKED